MANDLGSAMSMLKGVLGDDAESKLASIMQGLAEDSSADSHSTGGESVMNESSGIGIDANTIQYIMRMKGILDEMGRNDDDRSRLLLSLRPYMREGRQKSIDNALKIMALTKLSGVFGNL